MLVQKPMILLEYMQGKVSVYLFRNSLLLEFYYSRVERWYCSLDLRKVLITDLK